MDGNSPGAAAACRGRARVEAEAAATCGSGGGGSRPALTTVGGALPHLGRPQSL